jgi:hypothetical protein
LRREPRGVLAVETLCPYGYPQVIVNRPVSATDSDIAIFPTLYWLTCPYLCRELAVLEGEGLIARFEQRIREDALFAAAVERNHENYAKRRLSLVPSDVQQRLKEEYPERYLVLAQSGVGGIRSKRGVKCLHTHVADYLVHGENPIGAEVMASFDRPLACPDKQCEDPRP